MKVLLFLLLFISHLSIYAQQPSNQISVRSQENGLSDPGMIVGTVTILPRKDVSRIYEFVFRGATHRDGKTIIKLRTLGKKKRFQPDYWDSNNNPVYVFVWKRSEGNYTFTNVDIFALFQIGRDTVNFPFSVKKGTITYVGNIMVNENKRSYTLNTKHQERDLYLIRRKYPDSYWDKYQNGAIITKAVFTEQTNR